MGPNLNELALFAGAGGGILGGKLLGWKTVCAVEIDPYAASVLLQRQNDGILPSFPIWDDICTFDGRPWRGIVGVVSGGFPCNDISAAGGGVGITGEQSGLWRHQWRIVREVRPKLVYVENSPLLTIRGIRRVLGDLAEVGYDAEWGVLGADDAGYDHPRKRIWIVAYLPGERRKGWNEEAETRRATGQAFGVEALRLSKIRHEIPAPDAFGSPDGVPGRMDRLKAVGNAQVPAVAALAWNVLMSRVYSK